MALNVKVALLICLGFIGGMCWVVNRVAAPLLPAPAPLLVRAAAAAEAPLLVPAGAPVQPDGGVTDIFAHSSAVSHAAEVQPIAPQAVAFAVYAPLADEAEMPPMLASVSVHAADDEPGPLTEDDFVTEAPPLEIALLLEPPVAVPLAVLAADARIIDAAFAPDDEFEGFAEPAEALLALAEDGGAESADASAPVAPPVMPDGRGYRVRSGDTLSRILLREWGSSDAQSIAAFLAVNPKVRARRQYTIRIGETLVVPERAAALVYLERTLADAGAQVATERAAQGERRARRVYTVRRHDTLVKIAQAELKDPNRWTDIARLNGLKNADRIVPGAELLLPEPSRSDT